MRRMTKCMKGENGTDGRREELNAPITDFLNVYVRKGKKTTQKNTKVPMYGVGKAEVIRSGV